MSRIVQVANFVTPTSGGLRTTLAHLASGYVAAGHEVVQVLPGVGHRTEVIDGIRRVHLPAPMVPGLGYRVLTDLARVRTALESLRPDVLEVHDRTTLRSLGHWASIHHVPSLVISHERVDRWLAQWLSRRLPLDRMADTSNASLAAAFDTVLCTTAWAAQEFTRLDVGNLVTVPLGVDLSCFTPRLGPSGRDDLLLVMASRLSREKRPDLAIEALRVLVQWGVPARLVIAGDGAMRAKLERQAADLPVAFLGFVRERRELAELLGSADVVLAPGPVETFGLAALEALACGTPVVVSRHSALPEVVAGAGRSAPSSGFCVAEQVLDLLTEDERLRRARSRARAEAFSWDRTVDGFLRAHGLTRQTLAA